MFRDILKVLTETEGKPTVAHIMTKINWDAMEFHHGTKDHSKQDDSAKHLAAHAKQGSKVDATVTLDAKVK